MALRINSRKKFWGSWSEDFISRKEELITPSNPTVMDFSDNIKMFDDIETQALSAWEYVYNSIDCKISPDWKTPEQTIEYGVADCENYSFLLASIFPNLGIKRSEIHIGYIHVPRGLIRKHVWNKVNGKIVDATGVPDDVRDMKYQTIDSFIIEVGTNGK